MTDRLRLYPDPVATEFRRAAAALHGVDPEMILAGNGSDDLLTIITRAFVGPATWPPIPRPATCSTPRSSAFRTAASTWSLSRTTGRWTRPISRSRA